MENKYKSLSVANSNFKSGSILNACLLFKNLLNEYCKADPNFYGLVINNLIEHYYFTSNSNRLMLNEIVTSDDNPRLWKLECLVKADNTNYIEMLLLCSDYRTRLLILQFIHKYFSGSMIDLNTKYIIMGMLTKQTSTRGEVKQTLEMINDFFSIFFDCFTSKIWSILESRPDLELSILQILKQNESSIDFSNPLVNEMIIDN